MYIHWYYTIDYEYNYARVFTIFPLESLHEIEFDFTEFLSDQLTNGSFISRGFSDKFFKVWKKKILLINFYISFCFCYIMWLFTQPLKFGESDFEASFLMCSFWYHPHHSCPLNEFDFPWLWEEAQCYWNNLCVRSQDCSQMWHSSRQRRYRNGINNWAGYEEENTCPSKILLMIWDATMSVVDSSVNTLLSNTIHERDFLDLKILYLVSWCAED